LYNKSFGQGQVGDHGIMRRDESGQPGNLFQRLIIIKS